MQFSQIWPQIQPKGVNPKTKGSSIIFAGYLTYKISFRTSVWAPKVLFLIIQRRALLALVPIGYIELTLRVP